MVGNIQEAPSEAEEDVGSQSATDIARLIEERILNPQNSTTEKAAKADAEVASAPLTGASTSAVSDTSETSENSTTPDTSDGGESALDETSQEASSPSTPQEPPRGYIRESEWTRKTQALAAEKREWEAAKQAEAERLKARDADYQAAIGRALAMADQGGDPVLAEWNRVDQVRLSQEDPARYTALRAQVEQRLALIDRMRRDQATAQVEQRKQLVEREIAALVEKVPAWKDAKTATSELTAIKDYLVSANGFAAKEVDDFIDHRALVVARKAMLYDQLQAAKDTLAEKRVQPVRKIAQIRAASGAQPTSTSTKALAERAKATGKTRDIAAAIEAAFG